jgi:succinate dehydrogenase / fumarate reductase iron-sulfur subunit
MPEYAIKVLRSTPDRPAPYWLETTIDLDDHRSVLDAIIALKERDGTLGIRYSCRAAICGSCGVRVNGRPHLACHTQLGTAQEWAGDGPIVVEPMGNMPVIKDLIVDMDVVHWAKVNRIRPWLTPVQPEPEREYVVDHETMVDITQTQACIQCGSCVSNCLSMEVDPLFVGPAALAKAFRFVNDPREAAARERLLDLAEDPHGMYTCTHCFQCVDACPKGVAPMNQIMRMRRAANADHAIVDSNNGHRHEHGFVENIKRNGILNESDLLADSWGGKLSPRFWRVAVQSLPPVTKALVRGKIGRDAIFHPHRKQFRDLAGLFDRIGGRKDRLELNLYVSGYEDDPSPVRPAVGTAADASASAPGPNARRGRSKITT